MRSLTTVRAMRPKSPLSSPSTGGVFQSLGWLPYATFTRDASGTFPHNFADQNVNGGSTYTYVLVGQTRGARFIIASGDSVREVTIDGRLG